MAGFPETRLSRMIRALGILEVQFLESEESKIDSQEKNEERQRMQGQQF